MEQSTKRDLNEAVGYVLDEREFYKGMRANATALYKAYRVDRGVATKLKDFKYYYGNGWVGNDPLVKEKGAQYPDRLSAPFIKALDAILVLRSTGNLKMLDPIIKSLEKRGIHLQVDDPNPYKFTDKIEPYIQAMCGNQADICETADKRKGIRDALKDVEWSNHSFHHWTHYMANVVESGYDPSTKNKVKKKTDEELKLNEKEKDLYTEFIPTMENAKNESFEPVDAMETIIEN